MKEEGVHGKSNRECSQKLISLSPIFSMPIFSSTEFSILCISCGSDNVQVTTIKTHPRGFLCICYTYITRWKATFCQRGLSVPVYLCVKVNAKIAENSCFWPVFQIKNNMKFHFLHFLTLFMWNTCIMTDRTFYLTYVKLAYTSTHTIKSFLNMVICKVVWVVSAVSKFCLKWFKNWCDLAFHATF